MLATGLAIGFLLGVIVGFGMVLVSFGSAFDALQKLEDEDHGKVQDLEGPVDEKGL